MMRSLFSGENINKQCVAASDSDKVEFPCDVDAPTAVSVAIGAGGLALLFVFFLMNSVSPSLSRSECPRIEYTKLFCMSPAFTVIVLRGKSVCDRLFASFDVTSLLRFWCPLDEFRLTEVSLLL